MEEYTYFQYLVDGIPPNTYLECPKCGNHNPVKYEDFLCKCGTKCLYLERTSDVSAYWGWIWEE